MNKKTIGLIMGILLLVGSASAALLTHYGAVTGEANVDQAVTVTGDLTYIIGDSPA